MIRIHREGRWIVAITLVALLALQIISALYFPLVLNYLVNAASLAVLILVMRFFRVPTRRPFLDEKTIMAPADGKVVVVEKTMKEEFMGGACLQISIFMSIHDVHINYFPVDGKVTYLKYHPGKFLLARNPKSSELNESYSTGIQTPFGPILVRQIAGTVARRIRNYATLGQPSRQGREMGFIKFGSRLDVFLPVDAKVQVEVGQRVTGSITPLAGYK